MSRPMKDLGDGDFTEALLDAGKRDGAGEGARARALTALGLAAGAAAATGTARAAAQGGAKMGLGFAKWIVAVALCGGAAVGTWRFTRATDAPGPSAATAQASATTEETPPPLARLAPLPPGVPSQSAAAAPSPASAPARAEAAPSANAARAAIDAPAACSTHGRPVDLMLTNTTADAIDLIWIDYSCREVPKGRVGPGETWRQYSYDSHPWRVRDAATQRLLKDFTPALTSDFTVAIDDDRAVADAPPTACSTRSRPLEVRFENRARSTVEAFWVDYQCREVSYGSIAPGETKAQSTFDGHPWRFRDAATHRLLVDYKPEPLKVETLPFP